MPKISVIVPVYRVEQYLDRCVESILAQTFTDFELILVDDGSPDSCPQMCDEWAKKDQRIRVLHKANNGVSAARNDGVKLSNAEFVTFVDSDDWICPNYLKVLYDNLSNNNADISVAKFHKKNRDEIHISDIVILDGKTAVSLYGRIDDERYRTCMAKLVNKKIVLQHPFPTDRVYSEDMATIYKWYFSAGVVVGTDLSLYYYDINDDSISSQPYGLHRLGDLKTWEEMLSFLENEKFDELLQFKLKEYSYELCYQYENLEKINQKALARKVKSRLLEIYRKHDIITIKKTPDLMECIFPRKMYAYWTLKGIINKFKRNKNA